MLELAKKYGLDRSQSYEHSDTESYLPILQAVSHPVAVNPQKDLARVAKEEGWQVLTFETIGRRLALGGATGTTALVGGVAAMLNRRRDIR